MVFIEKNGIWTGAVPTHVVQGLAIYRHCLKFTEQIGISVLKLECIALD